MPRVYKFRDLTNQRFGSLIAQERQWAVKSGKRVHFWICLCDCGERIKLQANHLTSGFRTSCGCRFGFIKTEVAFHALRNRYRQQARARHLLFALPDDVLIALFSGHCHYCGCGPDNLQRLRLRKIARPNHQYVYNGIDRIDNSKGYIPENVVSACYRCNHAKGTLTVADFLVWIRRVSEYQNVLAAAQADPK